MSRLFERLSKLPLKVTIPAGIIIFLIIIVGLASGGKSKSSTDAAATNPAPARSEPVKHDSTTQKARKHKDKKAPMPKPKSDKEKITEALGDEVNSSLVVGGSEVLGVGVGKKSATITLETPEGGFEGTSVGDTNHQAELAFSEVYLTGFEGETMIVFKGGLVSTVTGKALPNATTAAYAMPAHLAAQIDWSDEEALFSIDWDLYREFCSPALKDCE